MGDVSEGDRQMRVETCVQAQMSDVSLFSSQFITFFQHIIYSYTSAIIPRPFLTSICGFFSFLTFLTPSFICVFLSSSFPYSHLYLAKPNLFSYMRAYIETLIWLENRLSWCFSTFIMSFQVPIGISTIEAEWKVSGRKPLRLWWL